MSNHLRAFATPILLVFSALLSAPGSSSQGDPAQDLERLRERLEQERKAWMAVYRQAESDEERAALRQEFPLRDFVDGLAVLADRGKGTGVAARAWLEVYRLSVLVEDPPTFERAVDRLVSDCMDSPELASLTLELTYGAPAWGTASAQAALRRIVVATSDPSTRANGMAQLALLVGLDPALGEAGLSEARALLERIRSEFKEREFIGMSGEAFATGALFEIERLHVGATAPDFEIADQDGVRFKLSDYRGRVVVLDFWGFV